MAHQAESPMAKVKLLEVHSLGASITGLQHFLHRLRVSYSSWGLKLGYYIVYNRDRISIHNVKGEQPKGDENSRRGTGGLPKGLKTYGNRGIVVPSRGRVPGINVRHYHNAAESFSTVSTDSIRKLKKINELCISNHEYIITDKLYRLMYDKTLYEIAYQKLRSKPGNMTPGITPTTLDGFSSQTINDIIEQLRNGSFKFSPGRRVLIPKPQGGTRPLTVAPPRDKIVQEVMRMILEAIFEPGFSAHSHGFRPGKSCHSALRDVRTRFQVASWFIEGDISKCFDSINHNRLMELIEARIRDQRFLELIRRALNAGYMEFSRYNHSLIGTPQGSIISPILSNIYMNELDRFADQLSKEFNKGKSPTRNPVYLNLQYRKKIAKSVEEKRRLHRLLLNTPSKSHIDLKFKKLVYVRYADDWIIGVRGSKEECRMILGRVKDFLSTNLQLNLSETKTLITNIRKNAALFLGTEVARARIDTYAKRRRSFISRNDKTLRLTAPMGRILKKLESSGFLQEGKASPKWK